MNTLIKTILHESNYSNNPYFTSLKDGTFDKEDFIETQLQFYFAVIFFPRPMAAAAAKAPTHAARLEIMRNVWEEHGEGNSNKFHGSTFLEFIGIISDYTEHDLAHRKLWPEVRAFNTLLTGACVMDEYIIGVSVMGMIELMFSNISAWIGKSTVNNGWITKNDLIHYNLHEELDIKHAQDFFDVLKPSWDESDENKYLIEQGLRMGAYCFDNLYKGLYENRTRRMISDSVIVRHQRT